MLILDIGEDASHCFHSKTSKFAPLREPEIIADHPAAAEISHKNGTLQPLLLSGGFIKPYKAFQQSKRTFTVGSLQDFSRPARSISSGSISVKVHLTAFLCRFQINGISEKLIGADKGCRRNSCAGRTSRGNFACTYIYELTELAIFLPESHEPISQFSCTCQEFFRNPLSIFLNQPKMLEQKIQNIRRFPDQHPIFRSCMSEGIISQFSFLCTHPIKQPGRSLSSEQMSQSRHPPLPFFFPSQLHERIR